MTTAYQTLFPGFEQRRLPVTQDVEIALTIGGSGPPLLLLHGHPQTHASWHRVAPSLARQFTLVMADLRGYGDSSKPEGDAGHANYSKRVMAGDMVAMMRGLGFDRFDVRPLPCGHYIAEEAPARLLDEVLPFLASGPVSG